MLSILTILNSKIFHSEESRIKLTQHDLTSSSRNLKKHLASSVLSPNTAIFLFLHRCQFTLRGRLSAGQISFFLLLLRLFHAVAAAMALK